jgi:hypothetical protein
MKQVLKFAAAPATAMFAMAFMTIATPASAGDYCVTNTSGMRGCGYATMEQCQAAVAGAFGNCYRDPFLPAAGTSASKGTSTNNALAYQPKHAGAKNVARHAKTAVDNQ